MILQSASEIHDKAADGDVESVLRLLDDGTFVDDRDCDGYTPLHRAADRGKKEV